MFNKFQTLINILLSEDNTAGDGGVFGTPSPSNSVATTNDIKTSMAVAGLSKKKKKKDKSGFSKTKMNKAVLYTTRRTLPSNDL